ncbi:MAG: TIR domain-containing protein [Candidatus Competibacteraceae bacterium]
MPALRNYDLFISHAWAYNEDYYRLERLLKLAPNFMYRNYSVPIHDPLIDPDTHVGKREMAALLRNQLFRAQIVLIIAGMYVPYRYWIQQEIDMARSYQKPILGVVPWGHERIPIEVKTASREIVRWNTSSIVDAIRRNAM